jgi:hypothetical protein
MAQPVSPPTPPQRFSTPPGAEDRALARKNMTWGWAIFGLFWVLFAATFGVGFAWLWLS